MSNSGKVWCGRAAGASKHAPAAVGVGWVDGVAGEASGLRSRRLIVGGSPARTRPARSSSKHSWRSRSRSGSAAPPAGANWNEVTIAEMADRGHHVGVDVGVGIGPRPGRDDADDHADRLVEQDRAVLRQREARPQEVDVGRGLVGLVEQCGGDAGEDVLERHEDGLVRGPLPQGVDVDLELRVPGGHQRLLLVAEVVVERPDGHVRGGGDVVGGDLVQPTLERQSHDGPADGGARLGLLAFAESGGVVHVRMVHHFAANCKIA